MVESWRILQEELEACQIFLALWFCQGFPKRLHKRGSRIKKQVFSQWHWTLGWDGDFFQWPEMWYGDSRWSPWALALMCTTASAIFKLFKMLSGKWDQRRGRKSLKTSSWLFSQCLGCEAQHLGHIPVWIITLWLASFTLLVQLNKVFRRTSCHNLCYAAVGY